MGYPGWDSLGSVTRIHNWAEGLGIFFLAALVFCEVVSFKYGHRRDALAEAQQEAVQRDSDDRLSRIAKDVTPRKITEAQYATLREALKGFITKYRPHVTFYIYDEPETVSYGNRMVEIYGEAGAGQSHGSGTWRFGGHYPDEHGIKIADQPAPAAKALQQAFAAAGIETVLAPIQKHSNTRTVGPEEFLVEIWPK